MKNMEINIWYKNSFWHLISSWLLRVPGMLDVIKNTNFACNISRKCIETLRKYYNIDLAPSHHQVLSPSWTAVCVLWARLYITLWQKCWVVIAKMSMQREVFPSWACRVMICLACSSQRSFSPCTTIRCSRSASDPSKRPPRRATHDFWRTDTQTYTWEDNFIGIPFIWKHFLWLNSPIRYNLQCKESLAF